MLLDDKIAQNIITRGLEFGADFVEIFVEKKAHLSLNLLNKKIEDITSGTRFGIGIRLLYGSNVVYGYSNNDSKESLLTLVKALADRYRTKSLDQVNFTLAENIVADDMHLTKYKISSRSLTDRFAPLLETDRLVRRESDKISQVSINNSYSEQEIQVFNSEGLNISDTRNYVRFSVSAIAEDGSERASGSYFPGGLGGFEFVEGLNLPAIASEVTRQALVELSADYCPAGEMPVLIGNGFGGVIFHEACGHLLETTAVAKKSSVFWDKKDQMIASSVVNAFDDGTMANEWGSINIDDEGMPTKRTQLIKDGRLVNFLADKVGAMQTGHPRTGSARRESYQFAPASRMRNTFIDSGTDKLDDMLASIDHGIYCHLMGGGSVSPGTGEFNFSVREASLIKNGKIDRPLKSVTLIGTGPDILKNISMVGSDLSHATGFCGSVSGSIPTNVGQPPIKVDKILVGGRA